MMVLATLSAGKRRVRFTLQDVAAVRRRLSGAQVEAAQEAPWRLADLVREPVQVDLRRHRVTLTGQDLMQLFAQVRQRLHTFPVGARVLTLRGEGEVVGYVAEGGAEVQVLKGLPEDGSAPMHLVQIDGRQLDQAGELLKPLPADLFAAQPVEALRAVWKNTLRIHDQAAIPSTKAALVEGLAAHFHDYPQLDPLEALFDAYEFGGQPLSIAEVRRAHSEEA